MSTALLLAAGLFGAAQSSYFEVSARYDPPAAGQAQGTVLVSFLQTQGGVHVNQLPAVQLLLDPKQVVLDYKAPTKVTALPPDPDQIPKLDLSKPVRFPAALRKDAPKGAQSVTATVTFSYCSETEHWCRRGREEVAFPVTVP